MSYLLSFVYYKTNEEKIEKDFAPLPQNEEGLTVNMYSDYNKKFNDKYKLG